MSTRPNALAFPFQDNGSCVVPDTGLTKREYFASRAPIPELIGMYFDKPCATQEQCAQLAVGYADALISELNKESDRKNENRN